VETVVCGDDFSCVALKDQRLFSFGRNDRHQLGLGGEDTESHYRPSQVRLEDKKVVQLRAGKQHVLALSLDALVYSWGDNHAGQRGDGSFVAGGTPSVVQTLIGRPICQIAAGAQHCVALTPHGAVYGE
jgi:alpha-tubulin suppressor-like RCC1 family protein